MNVEEIMSKPAVTCRPGQMLNTAAQLMWEHDCGVLPVVNDAGQIVGIVTDRDICMAAYTRGQPLDAISINDAMAKQVFACHAEDALDNVEQLMADKQIRRVPVVDAENRPTGVLSLNDIARFAASFKKTNGFVRDVTHTLSSICQPRAKAAARISVGQHPAMM